MVYLKKISIYILLTIISFILAELTLAYIFKYPKYGLTKKIFPENNTENIYSQNIYEPFSKYRVFEEKYKIFQRNNLGLPGINVTINDTINYIFIIGDSYAEADAINPDMKASSVFQKLLKESNKNYQVINLAYGGADTYSLGIRCNYYSKIFNPKYIILLIAGLRIEELEKYSNIDSYNFVESRNKFDGCIKFLRNEFSSFNLLYTGSKRFLIKSNVSDNNQENVNSNTFNTISEKQSNLFFKSLKNLKKFKNCDLGLLCISSYGNLSAKMMEFSSNENISFYQEDLLSDKKYRINNAGHLNEYGNEVTGELLYKLFKIMETNELH